MSTARTRKKKPAGKRGKPRRGSFLGTMLELLFLTFPGKLLLAGLAVAFIFAINILVAGNQFDRFFLYLGIELVLAAAFFWLKFLLKK